MAKNVPHRPHHGILRRALEAGAAAAALAAAGWGGYAAVTWKRYGRKPSPAPPNELLDRFLPVYEVAEVHETPVAAPAELTWEAAMAVSFDRSPLVRAVFRGRELMMRAHTGLRQPRPFLDEIRGLGWAVLAETPGRRLAFGAATRPWEADVRFRGMSGEEFRAFDEPGYAKIAWTLEVEPAGEAGSVFRTATRVSTTDTASRARFRRYWAVFSPGIILIRREMLRLVRQDAQRRAAHPGARHSAPVEAAPVEAAPPRGE